MFLGADAVNTRNILGFGLGPIAGAAFGLVSIPAIAWAFTPEDVGRLNIVNIVVSFSVLLFSLGLDQAYVREFHETRDHATLLKSCFLPGLIIFVIFAVLGAVLSERLSFWLFGISNSLYFWIALACAFAAFISRFLSLILRMNERGLAFSMSQVIPKALFLLLIGLIVLADLPRHFVQLQLTLLASTVAVLLIYVWNTRHQWMPAWGASIDASQLRTMVRYSLPLNFAGVGYWGLAATSALALRSLSSFRELGIYSIAMSVAGIAAVFQSIFTIIWAPVVYKWVAVGVDMSRVDRVARQALAVVCSIFVMFGMFSWLIDYVLPSQYTQVKYLVLCGIVQPLLYTLSEVTSIGINITRRTMLSLWSTLIALFANVGLNILLVPEFGASGAMVANALAFMVFFVARTESSAYVWRQFPRAKLYAFTTGAVSLSVVTVALGPTIGDLFSLMWLAALPVIVWAFRHEGRALVGNLQSRMRLSMPVEK